MTPKKSTTMLIQTFSLILSRFVVGITRISGNRLDNGCIKFNYGTEVVVFSEKDNTTFMLVVLFQLEVVDSDEKQ
jgi:hypothetical protein